MQYFQRIRVDIGCEILTFAVVVRVSPIKQAVVQPHLSIQRLCRRDPMDRGLYLASIRSIAAPRRRIIVTAQFDDVSLRILDNFLALDEKSVAQTDFAP